MVNELLVMDVDGTQPTTLESFNKTIRRILSQGSIGVSVATGNSFRSLQGRLGYVPNVPMVLDNGGSICTIEGKNLVYHPIETYELNTLEFVLRQKGIEYAYFSSKASRVLYFYCTSLDMMNFIKKKYTIRRSQITPDPTFFLQQCTKYRTCQIAIKVTPGVRLSIPSVLNHSYSQHVSMYGIQNRGINKGVGVLKLKQILDIPQEEIVLAGDDYNDITMFEFVPAPVKIAVSQKSPELIELATHVIDSPEDLGPFLEKLFLESK